MELRIRSLPPSCARKISLRGSNPTADALLRARATPSGDADCLRPPRLRRRSHVLPGVRPARKVWHARHGRAAEIRGDVGRATIVAGMQTRALKIDGAWEFTPQAFG